MRSRGSYIDLAAAEFMPRLWKFVYPLDGRRFERSRRVALRAWAFAFRCHVQMHDWQTS